MQCARWFLIENTYFQCGKCVNMDCSGQWSPVKGDDKPIYNWNISVLLAGAVWYTHFLE